MTRHGGTTKAKDALLTDPPFYLPEFEKSYRYIIDEYNVAPKEIAIFMPCAVRKPYSASPEPPADPVGHRAGAP